MTHNFHMINFTFVGNACCEFTIAKAYAARAPKLQLRERDDIVGRRSYLAKHPTNSNSIRCGCILSINFEQDRYC